MNFSKPLLALLLLPFIAVLTANAAESAGAGEQQSSSQPERETVMQEAMSEFSQWRQEREQSRTSSAIDWSSYNRESGWSTGLSGDSGSHRAVPDLTGGSVLGSRSLISESLSPASGPGSQALDRPSPASSLVGEFSRIGRSGSESGRSLFDDDSAATPGSSIRSLSSTESQESSFSSRNTTSSPFSSTPWTSGAATTEAATTEAATTSPSALTPSRTQRNRPQDLTPNYLRN